MTDFTSPLFGVFLIILIPLYWMFKRKGQNVLLFFASCLFYAGWDWRFLCLLLLSTFVDYQCARIISKNENPKVRKSFLIMSIVINVGALCFFKYFNFFYDSAMAALTAMGMQAMGGFTLKILLPVGISFYTFQSLGYLIDVYRKEIPSEKSWLDFAVFVMFFPHMVAGPIMRAKTLLVQFHHDRVFNSDTALRGLVRIFWGLFKKLVIANQLALYSDSIFGRQSFTDLPSLEGLTAILAFSLQIYTDFSAYTDIARGVSRLMGFELMVNFNKPYLSTSIGEFWRRWHISLSTWMRDYIYISLGGNRCSKLRRNINLLLTFLISGLWHGANWTFVAWGAYHGILNVVEQSWSKLQKSENSMSHWLVRGAAFTMRCFIVFSLVAIGWSLFRAPTFVVFFEVWKSIFKFQGVGNGPIVLGYMLIFWVAILISYGVEKLDENNYFSPIVINFGFATVPPIFAVATWLFAADMKPPFIYFQF